MADPQTDPFAAAGFEHVDSAALGGRPIIRKGEAPPSPSLPQGWEIGPDGVARPIGGLPPGFTQPKPDKPPETWRVAQPGEPGYMADRTTMVSSNGDIKYGPAPANAAAKVAPFRVGDSEAINHGFQMLDNIAAARQQAQLPHAAGTWATTLANIPVVGGALGQNRSNLMTSLGAITGDLRQLGIMNLYQATGQKGVGTIARSTAEQTALQNSMAALGYDPASLKPTGAQPDAKTLGTGLTQAQTLYEKHLARMFNMDPDNPDNINIIQAAEANPANRQALLESYKQNGGKIGSLRFVTKADGHDIPPIIVPTNASDEDVRNAVRNASYNVAPNTTVISGQQPFGQAQAQAAQAKGPQAGSAFSAANDAVGNMILAGLGDPIEAGAATLANGHSYDQNLAAVKGRNSAEYNAHPLAGWFGTLAGLVPSLGAGVARGGAEVASEAAPVIQRLLGLGRTSVRNAAIATPIGAVEGAANAGSGNRTSGAETGAATGAALGAVGTPLVHGAGKAIGWLGSRLLPEAGAWHAFSHLVPEADPQAMAAEAERLKAAGVEPAAIDTLNNASLDHVRNSVGSRAGSNAATILNEEAAARAAAAPGRIANQARTVVGPAPTAAGGPVELRNNLSQSAGEQFAQDFAAHADKRVMLTPDLKSQLSRPQGLEIVRAARKLPLSDKAEAELAALPGQFGQSLDMNKWLEGFGPKAVAQIMEQIGKGPSDLSLEALNALRQVAYHKTAGAIPGMQNAITSVHAAARDAGVKAVPEYGPLLERYATQAGVASANNPDAISLGENLLSGNPEEMKLAARGLPHMDEGVGFPDHGTVSPRQGVGEGVVRSVEQGASKSVSGLTRQMGTPEQQARNRAILTPGQATDLENRVGAEGKRVASAQRAAPASAPSENGSDVASAAVASMYHSPAMKAGKIAQLMSRAQISPDQANRIAKGLVDPGETNAIIQKIQRAGYTRARAGQLYSMLAIQLGAAGARGNTAKTP